MRLGRVCTAIQAASPAEMLHRADAALADGRFLEFRLDSLPRPAASLPKIKAFLAEHPNVTAIGTCQATIEAVDPRFTDPAKLDPLTILADCGMHGGLVVGEPIADWRPEMFAGLHVVSTVNGALQREAVGSNPGGTDLMRLLVWLANSEVVRAAGGLTAGVVVTTGSWTGADQLPAGAYVVGTFDGFPPVEATFS